MDPVMPSKLINPITSKQAKKLYRMRDPTRPSKDEERRIERSIELDRRAEAIKDRERKQKERRAKQKQQEEQERYAKCHNSVGLATQLAGYNHTQKRMKNWMENFIGLKKHEKEVGRSNALIPPVQKSALVEENKPQSLSQGAPNSVAHSGKLQLQDQGALDNFDNLDDQLLPYSSNATSVEISTNAAKQSIASINPWDQDDIDDEFFFTLLPDFETHGSKETREANTHPHQVPVVLQSEPAACADHTNNTGVTAKAEVSPQTKARGIKRTFSQASSCWDDFLVSNTQISRELKESPVAPKNADISLISASHPHKSSSYTRDIEQRKTTNADSPNFALQELGLCTQDLYDLLDDDETTPNGPLGPKSAHVDAIQTFHSHANRPKDVGDVGTCVVRLLIRHKTDIYGGITENNFDHDGIPRQSFYQIASQTITT